MDTNINIGAWHENAQFTMIWKTWEYIIYNLFYFVSLQPYLDIRCSLRSAPKIGNQKMIFINLQKSNNIVLSPFANENLQYLLPWANNFFIILFHDLNNGRSMTTLEGSWAFKKSELLHKWALYWTIASHALKLNFCSCYVLVLL